MRKLYVAIGVAIALLAALVFGAPLLIDANDHKATIAQALGDRLGLPVEIGRVEFQTFPRLRLRAQDLIVRGDGGTMLAGAREADFDLSLPDLLRGDMTFSTVRLKGPRVAAAAWRSVVRARRAAGGTSGRLRLRSLIVEDGELRLENGVLDGVEGQLDLPQDWRGTVSGSLAGAWNGHPVTGDFTLGAGTGGQEAGERGISLDLGAAGATARLAGMLDPAGPSVRGNVSASLTDAAVLRDWTGILPPVEGAIAATGRLTADGKAVAVDDLDIQSENLRAGGRLHLARKDKWEGFLSLHASRLVLGPGAAETLPARFTLPGDASFTFDLSADALAVKDMVLQKVALLAALDQGAFTISRFAAQLGGGSDVNLTGALTTPGGVPTLAADFDLSSDNIRALAQPLLPALAAVPADRLTRLAAHGRLEASGAGIRLDDATLRLDGNDYRLNAVWAVRARPLLSIGLAANLLDLDGYGLAPAPARIGDPGFDLALTLDAQKVTAWGRSGGGVSGGAILTRDGLDLDHLTIDALDGASWSARGHAGPGADGRVDMTVGLSANRAGDLLAAWGAAPPAGMLGGALAAQVTLGGSLGALSVAGQGDVGGLTTAFSGTVGALAAPALDVAGSLKGDDFRQVLAAGGLAGGDAPLGPVDCNWAIRLKDGELSLSLQGNAGPLALEAATTRGGAGGTLHVHGGGGNAAALLPLLGLPGPAAGPLSLDLDARREGGVVSGRTSAAAGAVRLAAEGRLDLAAAPVAAEGRIDLSGIDTAWITGPSWQDPVRWPTAALDLSFLDAGSGRLHLTVADSMLAGVPLKALAADLALDRGRLSVTGLDGKLASGTLSGTVELARADGGAEAALDLGLDHAVLPPPAAAPGLGGLLDLSLKGRTRGRSLFDLAAHFDGTARLALAGGVLRGLDLRVLAAGPDGGERGLGAMLAASAAGQTAIAAAAADWAISEGSGRTIAATADVPGAGIVLAGTADLPSWTLRLDAAAKASADLPPIYVDFAGPLHAPAVTVETREVEGYYRRRAALESVKPLPAVSLP